MRTSLFILMFPMLVAVASCKGKDNPDPQPQPEHEADPIPVESVTLVPDSITMKEGDTEQISVIIEPQNATDQTLTWVSFNKEVVDLGQNGQIIAVGEGITTVAAYAYGTSIKGECEVTVLSRVPEGAVDLGLPVYWAACNVGTSQPGQTGAYFSWGGVSPHANNIYKWDNYEWCNGSMHSFTRYNDDNNYGTSDGWTTLISADDAAAHYLKGNWRMPTAGDFEDLIGFCTVEWEKKDGVLTGARLTGSNGNSIFFPVSGEYDEYGLRNETAVYLWSSSLSDNYPFRAKALRLNEGGNPLVTAVYRYEGMPVRGVCPKD